MNQRWDADVKIRNGRRVRPFREIAGVVVTG